MAAARAYLISFLAMQRAVNPGRFATRFPAPWLVWEAGTWSAPASASKQTMTGARPKAPGKGDALCLELAVDVGGKLVAGRQETAALVVNDATFSREQFVFTRSAGELLVALAAGAQPGSLNGAPLGPQPRALHDGDALTAGAVTLRFHTPASFTERLAALEP